MKVYAAGKIASFPQGAYLLYFHHRTTSRPTTRESKLSKRIATVAAAIAVAALTAFGASGPAAATTVPDASCINSDPLGTANVIICAINATVQVPIDLTDSLITVDYAGIHTVRVLTNSELDMLDLLIENVLNHMDVTDENFEQTILQVIMDSGIFDEGYLLNVVVEVP